MLISLEEGILGVQRGLAALWGRGLTSQRSFSLPCIKASQACQVMVTRFSQESRSSGKLVVMRQVRGQAGKSVHGSGWGSGLVRVTRWETAQWYLRSTMVRGQDWAQEVSLWAEVWIGGARGQAGGQLWLSWRPALLWHSSDRDWRSQSELSWGPKGEVWMEPPAEAGQGLWGLVVLSRPWQV